MSQDDFQFWTNALAGIKQDINEAAPQCGFYKLRKGKDAPWLPVMIRHDSEGVLRARVGPDAADPHDIWVACAKRPVSKEDAKVAFATGGFPGDAPAAIGDNSGDVSLIEQLSDYMANTVAWLKGRTITDKATADQAANRRNRVLELKKAIEQEWDGLALPHDTALKQLKSVYDAPVKQAQELNIMLRDSLNAFARAEQARIDAEQRAKYEAERKATEAARKAVEDQRAKQLRDDPIAAMTSPEPELPMPPPPPAPAKVALGGQVGRVTGLRTYWEAEITDYAAALQHYAQHPDVQALILKLAKADIKNAKGAVSIPGVKAIEDRRVA